MVRREPRVQGLEAEDAAQTIVGEEVVDDRGELAEGTESQQLDCRAQRARQARRSVVVAADEVGHLDVVEAGDPVAEPFEVRGFAGAAHGADLLGHGAATVPDAQLAAVREAGSVHRIHGEQREEVVHLGAGRAEAVFDELRAS